VPIPAAAVPVRLSVVPPFPPIATRLLALLSTRSLEIKDLAELISSDAMFTGRILQHANSVEFGLVQPIKNVRHALMTLGLERTRRITVTAATSVYSRVAMKAPELRRCWRHTLATAVLSEEISRRCAVFTESAYSAGIMHDIGRLGLLVAYPAAYESTVRDAAERCLDLLDYEKEIFGIDHAEAGRLLSVRWNLPQEFQIIAGRHHDPCEGVEVTLLKIVHVACRLADYFGYEVTRPLKPPDFDDILRVLPGRVRERFLADGLEHLGEMIHKNVLELDSDEDDDDPKAAWTSIRKELAPDAPEPIEEGLEPTVKLAVLPPPAPEPASSGFWPWLIRLFWPR
jgi:HD-like signal output (HDOD) protein